MNRRGRIRGQMTTWFTADLHFGHANIISYSSRPFADATAMNEALIERWNDSVRMEDSVWLLGDVALGPHRRDPRTRQSAQRAQVAARRQPRQVLGGAWAKNRGLDRAVPRSRLRGGSPGRDHDQRRPRRVGVRSGRRIHTRGSHPRRSERPCTAAIRWVERHPGTCRVNSVAAADRLWSRSSREGRLSCDDQERSDLFRFQPRRPASQRRVMESGKPDGRTRAPVSGVHTAG